MVSYCRCYYCHCLVIVVVVAFIIVVIVAIFAIVNVLKDKQVVSASEIHFQLASLWDVLPNLEHLFTTRKEHSSSKRNRELCVTSF